MGAVIVTVIVAAALASPAYWLALRQREAIERAAATGASEQRKTASGEIDQLIRSLIEAIPRPVLVTTADRVILDANRPALYLIGLPRGRVVGRVLATIIQDYETTQMLIAAATSGVAQEHTVLRASDRETWHVSVQPLSLASEAGGEGPSRVSHLLLFIDDETQLRYLETVRKDFVASVSHELRTPLASVKLMAETLADAVTSDPPMAQSLAGRITGEVDHLTELVDDLLELSRIETGHITLELEPTDIAGVIEVAAERMRGLAAERALTILTDTPDDLPAVQADGERVGQVLINLIHNAIKFTPDGGSITISAGRGATGEAQPLAASARPGTAPPPASDAPVVVVRVSDTGVGIAEDDLPRVFERFWKAKDLALRLGSLQTRERSTHSSGTGLGLAIARHIVEAHNGQIWVESQVGRGSTFSFSLPLATRAS